MPGRDPNDTSEIPGLAATVTPEEDPTFPEPDLDDSEEPVQEAAPAPVRPPRAERPRPTPPPANPEIGKLVNINCRCARPCGGRVAKIVNVFKLGDFGGTARRYKCQNCKQPFTITV